MGGCRFEQERSSLHGRGTPSIQGKLGTQGEPSRAWADTAPNPRSKLAQTWDLPRRWHSGPCLLLAHVGHAQHVARATPSQARGGAGGEGDWLGLFWVNPNCRLQS